MTRSHTRPSSRVAHHPERRLLAAVLLRAVRDLFDADPRLASQAAAFFDEEGVALAAQIVGIPPVKVRQRLAEVCGG